MQPPELINLGKIKYDKLGAIELSYFITSNMSRFNLLNYLLDLQKPVDMPVELSSCTAINFLYLNKL